VVFNQATDVDDNGRLEAFDALLVLNALQRGQRAGLGSRIPTTDSLLGIGGHSMDVDGDEEVSPADALAVIYALHQQAKTQAGQGESPNESQGEQAKEIDQAIWSYFHDVDPRDDEDAFDQLRYDLPFLP